MLVYLEVLFRHWLRFIALLVLLPLAIVIGTIAMFPTYRGSAQLWVDDFVNVGLGAPSGWSIYLTPSQNMSDSFTQLLQTQAFRDTLYSKIIQSGAFPSSENYDIGGSIDSLLVVAPASHLMVVSASCDLRSVCVKVVATAINEFRDQQINMEQQQADVAISFFSQRLKTARPARDAAQAQVEQYLALHPNLRTDPNAQLYDPTFQQLSANLTDTKSTVDDLESKVARDEYIASTSSETLQIGPRIVDPPQITKGGILGDGSSLRRAMFGLLGCYAVGGTYIFLFAWVDKTAREPRELERRLKVPVVVTIQKLPRVA